jgi:hypothetical protein
MTTNGTGGSQVRVAEYVEGLVQSVNDRGIHLVGEDAWRNISRYAGTLATPAPGQRVRLGLDGSGFVRELLVVGEPAPAAIGTPSTPGPRAVALLAAAIFCGGKALNTEVGTADVLKVAAAFQRWLEDGDT